MNLRGLRVLYFLLNNPNYSLSIITICFLRFFTPPFHPWTKSPRFSRSLNKENNKFRIIDYEKAADAVEHASSELKDIWDEGKLEEIPGIGKSLATHFITFRTSM